MTISHTPDALGGTKSFLLGGDCSTGGVRRPVGYCGLGNGLIAAAGVKVCVPVNLRSFFPSETVRNFALYVNPGMEPRLGHYTIEELTNIVHCQMALEATEKFQRQVVASVNLQLLERTPIFLRT